MASPTVVLRGAALALLVLEAPAAAQSLIEVPEAKVHRLISKQVGDSFEIRVLLPPTIPGESTRFPVVYMTDVHGDFMVDEDVMRLMTLGDVPRFIAAEIGYPGARSILQALSIRTRDLTHVPVKERGGWSNLPIHGMVEPAVPNGGAGKFLAFIRDELIPFIDGRYPTDRTDRGYWGNSLGGLLGCHVLFTRPDTVTPSAVLRSGGRARTS